MTRCVPLLKRIVTMGFLFRHQRILIACTSLLVSDKSSAICGLPAAHLQVLEVCMLVSADFFNPSAPTRLIVCQSEDLGEADPKVDRT